MNPTLAHVTSLLATSLVLGSFATGCASEEEEDPGKEGNTASKASALTTPVEEASQSPSGNVDSTTLPGLVDAYEDFELTTLGGELPGGLDIDFESAVAGCASGDELSGTVDMSCATGGEYSGSVSYEIGVEGSTSYVYFAMNDLCSSEVCIDGEGAVKVSASNDGASSVVAGNLTIARDAQVDELRYGVSVTTGGFGVTSEVVLWHNGQSYVVSVSVGAGGTSYEIAGQNGAWSCDLSGDSSSLAGSCSHGADSLPL